MTFNEIKAALKRYGFDDQDPLNTWVNSAIDQIIDEADVDWIFLEERATLTGLAGVADVSLPSDCSKVKSVRDTTVELVGSGYGTALEIITYQDYNRIPNQSSSGSPQCAVLTNTNLMTMWPVPTVDSTYDLLYHKKLTSLVNSSDVPEIPKEYHYTIVRLAAATALMAENEEERAQTAMGLYQIDLDRMRLKYGSRQLSNPEYVISEG